MARKTASFSAESSPVIAPKNLNQRPSGEVMKKCIRIE
jgi:hypothetical protein